MCILLTAFVLGAEPASGVAAAGAVHEIRIDGPVACAEEGLIIGNGDLSCSIYQNGDETLYYQERRHNNQLVFAFNSTFSHNIDINNKYTLGINLNHTTFRKGNLIFPAGTLDPNIILVSIPVPPSGNNLSFISATGTYRI